VESSRPLIEARGHQLKVRIEDASLRLLADATRLEQVLANLLNNAAKYTEPGGQIDFTVRREGDEAVLVVRDNGIGIARELLPRVFELFMQAHSTLDRALGGLGIGLTLVRRLVELHNGTVEARSEGPGKGSEFVVRLPLLSEPLSAEVADPNAPAEEKHSRRVLVVDDNLDAARSLALMLRLDGHEVEMSHNGIDALEVARKYRPEVVLLDIGLPETSGYELAARLRAMPGMGGVRLIALTGYGRSEDQQRALAAGFDDHVVKPASLKALERILAGG
jgi:CheY-like chemotaxis protein/anti-sigma regulatory factor (Ser/Thr protein kinase)